MKPNIEMQKQKGTLASMAIQPNDRKHKEPINFNQSVSGSFNMWAILLDAFFGADQCLKSAFVWRIRGDLEVGVLPSTALVHLDWVWDNWAENVALHNALLADPVVSITVKDFLSWAS